MQPYRILPLPEEYQRRVRQSGRDDLEQPARYLQSAQGGEPCRDVLRRARAGEQLILASFSPFALPGPYHEYGPVFLLAEPSPEPLPLDHLFQAQARPDRFFQDQLVLRAYSADESIVDAALVSYDQAEALVQAFLARPEVAFLHARFPLHGCFACRIERA